MSSIVPKVNCALPIRFGGMLALQKAPDNNGGSFNLFIYNQEACDELPDLAPDELILRDESRPGEPQDVRIRSSLIKRLEAYVVDHFNEDQLRLALRWVGMTLKGQAGQQSALLDKMIAAATFGDIQVENLPWQSGAKQIFIKMPENKDWVCSLMSHLKASQARRHAPVAQHEPLEQLV